MPNDNTNPGTTSTTTQPVADNSGDIQIKTSGAANASQTTAATSVAQPVPQTPAPAAPTTSAPISLDTETPAQPQQPVNTRAFNLEGDVDDGSNSPIKPEIYAIPKSVKEKYPDLIELVKTTESMDDQEREYWFQIMPIMTPEQIEKFRNILITEKQQLSDLDKEYEDELNHLNEKHLLEWKEFETKEKSKAIKQAEQANSVSEKQMEEDLLAKLSDV